jgi:tol-pal system protein YbgF
MGCAGLGVQKDIERLERNDTLLGSRVDALDKESKNTSQVIRRGQADLEARLDDLQRELQSVSGKVEESRYFAQKASDENFGLREEVLLRLKEQGEDIEDLQRGYQAILTALNMKPPPSVRQRLPSAPGPVVDVPEPEETAVDPEEAYSVAYTKFKDGDYEVARKLFRQFLVQFPDTEYSDNAQFWVGDCFYREKQYEDAILEFEEVIKRFPEGNKVPDALLKQAFAFIERGDRNTARLLLEKIADQYPDSPQAETAADKIKVIR